MHTRRHFTCKRLLRRSILRTLRHLTFERLDLVARMEREIPEVPACIPVFDVDPELIELVWRRPFWVEPHAARFGLTKLRSARVRDQRESHRMSLTAFRASDELETSRDVSPLIAAADLKRHS